MNEREALRTGWYSGVRRIFLAAMAAVMLVTATVAVPPPRAEAQSVLDTTMLLFDLSGSMGQVDASGQTRLAAAQNAMITAIGGLTPGSENVGVRSFSDCGVSNLDQAPAPVDAASLSTTISSLQPGRSTDIAHGLSSVANDFFLTSGRSSVILLTDGADNCGGDPCATAQGLIASGIDVVVHAVGIGTAGTTAEEELTCIATVTGGTVVSVDNAEDLFEALDIAITGGATSAIVDSISTVCVNSALVQNDPALGDLSVGDIYRTGTGKQRLIISGETCGYYCSDGFDLNCDGVFGDFCSSPLGGNTVAGAGECLTEIIGDDDDEEPAPLRLSEAQLLDILTANCVTSSDAFGTFPPAINDICIDFVRAQEFQRQATSAPPTDIEFREWNQVQADAALERAYQALDTAIATQLDAGASLTEAIALATGVWPDANADEIEVYVREALAEALNVSQTPTQDEDSGYRESLANRCDRWNLLACTQEIIVDTGVAVWDFDQCLRDPDRDAAECLQLEAIWEATQELGRIVGPCFDALTGRGDLLQDCDETADLVQALVELAITECINDLPRCTTHVVIEVLSGVALGGLKTADNIADVVRLIRQIDRITPCTSFSADTMVLMADGSHRRFDQVQAGDTVWATDPTIGESGPQQVLAVWPHQDTLYELHVEGGSITTTEDHDFWNHTDQQWQHTQNIDVGDQLLSPDGSTVAAGSLDWSSAEWSAAYDLTVDDYHTYYVWTGSDDVLVHNCGPFIRLITRFNAAPSPRGVGPNGQPLQAHHGLQRAWAAANLPGYDAGLAPAILIENGVGYPHTIITTAQNRRRDARRAAGQDRWSSSLQQELGYIVDDLRAAGFDDDEIGRVLEQQYSMLDDLGVDYERVAGF